MYTTCIACFNNGTKARTYYAYEDLLQMKKNDKNVFNKIIIDDETCCFDYNSETKHQSSEWVGKN